MRIFCVVSEKMRIENTDLSRTTASRDLIDMKRTNYFFAESMIQRLKEAAKKHQTTAVQYIRQAIEAALKKDKL